MIPGVTVDVSRELEFLWMRSPLLSIPPRENENSGEAKKVTLEAKWNNSCDNWFNINENYFLILYNNSRQCFEGAWAFLDEISPPRENKNRTWHTEEERERGGMNSFFLQLDMISMKIKGNYFLILCDDSRCDHRRFEGARASSDGISPPSIPPREF